MLEDAELLRRYAREKSEVAFTALVQRHVNLVYAAALRRLGGNVHLAEDVTQQVFTALAREAASLGQHPVLSGWLYATTRNAAVQVVRSEGRRIVREQEAHFMNELTSSSPHDAEWERLRPVLDEAMDELDDSDRQAVLLRFFEGKSFADVGANLQLNENTARMRVERALDKLHALLARRGVTSTTAALGMVLGNQISAAAPAGLGAAVVASALAGAGNSAGAVATCMSITKLQIALAGALAVAGTAGFLYQAKANSALREETAGLRRENTNMAVLRTENLRLARAAADVERLRAASEEIASLEKEKDTLLKAQLRAAPAPVVAAPAPPPSWPNGLPVIPIGQLDQVPQVKYRANVKYPFEMRRAGTTGDVVVNLVVDASGNVQEVSAARSTHPDFESAAFESVKNWKFQPGRKGDAAVNTRMQIPIVFTIDPESKIIKPNDWF